MTTPNLTAGGSRVQLLPALHDHNGRCFATAQQLVQPYGTAEASNSCSTAARGSGARARALPAPLSVLPQEYEFSDDFLDSVVVPQTKLVPPRPNGHSVEFSDYPRALWYVYASDRDFFRDLHLYHQELLEPFPVDQPELHAARRQRGQRRDTLEYLAACGGTVDDEADLKLKLRRSPELIDELLAPKPKRSEKELAARAASLKARRMRYAAKRAAQREELDQEQPAQKQPRAKKRANAVKPQMEEQVQAEEDDDGEVCD